VRRTGSTSRPRADAPRDLGQELRRIARPVAGVVAGGAGPVGQSGRRRTRPVQERRARAQQALADLFAFSGYSPTPEEEAEADAELRRRFADAGIPVSW
jgi:hypothetical protein